MSNKENNKSVTDEPKGTAGNTDNDNPPAPEDSAPEDMSADEMAMFNKIMGEIEGEEGPDDPSEDAAPATINDAATDSQEGLSDDDLDEDQQKALESIMAQIQGGGDAADTDDANDTSGEAETIEDEDDFAAELEKVAKQADQAADQASDDTAPGETGDADDDLDEDQQKAFESIMAQIEGGADADDANDTSGETETIEDEDDFAAELEKVAKQADQASDDAAPGETDDADDDLDEDQQKALESIMAEIEGRSTPQPTAGPDQSPSTDLDPQHSPEPNALSSQDGDPADTDSSDAVDEIEDILKEITADMDAAPADLPGQTETAADEADELEIANREDDRIEGDKPGKSNAQTNAASTSSNADTKDSESVTPDKQAEANASLVPEKASPLPSIDQSKGFGKKTVLAALILATVSFAAAGFYFWPYVAGKGPASPPTVAAPPPVRDRQAPAPDIEAKPPAALGDGSSDQRPLKTIGEEIDRLRSELTAKRKEIEALQDYYRTGIDAEINNLVAAIQDTTSGRISLTSAMADPRFSMGIEAIQRRDATIRKLENPAHALYLNSEELFYLYRKAGLLSMMAEKTGDIDVDGFVHQARTIMNAHRSTLSQLTIDEVKVPESNIDSIWKRIESRLARRSKSSSPKQAAGKVENEAIWAAMCAGDFSRKHQLTELSPEAARCLATWKGKDLYLNELTVLTPAVARRLADWNGEWLGLNGLKSLSPEAAAYLAAWKGRQLSLNGLTRLSPRVAAILSEWQGDQIEMINVEHMAHWENPKTRLFLSEEMDRRINGQGQ